MRDSQKNAFREFYSTKCSIVEEKSLKSINNSSKGGRGAEQNEGRGVNEWQMKFKVNRKKKIITVKNRNKNQPDLALPIKSVKGQ